MGLFDQIQNQSQPPMVLSILPEIARRKIAQGQLPILKPSHLFLKAKESCHYADRAIYEKKIVNKKRVSRNMGYSAPGLFKGTRIHFGGGNADFIENITYQQIKGVLYITNQRIIFSGEDDGFHQSLNSLITITPYLNCVELQFSKNTYRIFVPDGNIVNQVLHMVK